MDVLDRADLPFPESLPEFQRLFPNDKSCAAYLEKTRWEGGFTCPHCGVVAEPFRIATRPGILTCRSCRRQTGLLVGAVMERSHTPLSVWFWAAYLVASQTQGMSAVQFQRQLGLTRYEPRNSSWKTQYAGKILTYKVFKPNSVNAEQLVASQQFQ